MPNEYTLEMKPTYNNMPEKTAVYFLIDNSSSVARECGDLVGQRFDFVNYILGILRTIPEPLSQNLYIGVGSFGNTSINFISIISLEKISPIFPLVNNHVSTGDYQDHSNGIENALSTMNSQDIQKGHLVILTDGTFSSEVEYINLQAKLKNLTSNGKFSVLVGLICKENMQFHQDILKWQNSIDGINGLVKVFDTIEDAGRQLLENLSLFLPNSIAKSPENYKKPINISGIYTKTYFRYWNSKTNNSILNITNTTTGDFWDVGGQQEIHDLRPITGCPQHTFSIPDPGDHWLLFIQAQTFNNLLLRINIENGKPFEVVNNASMLFNIQIDEGIFPQYDLRNWKDCFLLDLVGLDNSPINGFVTPIPFNNNYFKSDDVIERLYGHLHWYPPAFQNPGEVQIKIQLKVKDSSYPYWEAVHTLPVKFRAEFFSPNSTPLTIVGENILQKNISFINVATQPEVYLVTDLSLDNIIDLRNVKISRKFQKIDTLFNEKEASRVDFLDNCNLSEDISIEKYICLSLSRNEVPLFYSYEFYSFLHIVEDYNFNRLYFVWREDYVTKAKVWECNIEMIQVECVSVEPMPDIKSK